MKSNIDFHNLFVLSSLCFLLIGCKKYIILSNDKLGVAECVENTSNVQYSKTFGSHKECIDSPQFKEMSALAKNEQESLEKEKFEAKSLIVKSGSSVFCLRKIQMTKSESQFADRVFETFEECNASEELVDAIINTTKDKRKKTILTFCKHKKGFNNFCEDAIAKRVTIGMHEELVYLSIGKPQSTNTSTYSHGTHKQLVYGLGKYIYIENGFVSSMQNF